MREQKIATPALKTAAVCRNTATKPADAIKQTARMVIYAMDL